MSWISEYIQDKQFEYPNVFKCPIEPLRHLFLSLSPNILKDNGKLYVVTDTMRRIPIECYYGVEQPLEEVIMSHLLNHDLEADKIYNEKKDSYISTLGELSDKELEDALNKLYTTIQTSLNHAIDNIDHMKNYDEEMLTDIDFVYSKIEEMEFEPYLRLYKMNGLVNSVNDMFNESSDPYLIQIFITICEAYIKIMQEFLDGREIVKKTCITCDRDEILECYKKDVDILNKILTYLYTL